MKPKEKVAPTCAANAGGARNNTDTDTKSGIKPIKSFGFVRGDVKSENVPPVCKKVMYLLVGRFGLHKGYVIPYKELFDYLKLHSIYKPQAIRALKELEELGKIHRIQFRGVRII